MEQQAFLEASVARLYTSTPSTYTWCPCSKQGVSIDDRVSAGIKGTLTGTASRGG